jgi:pimeloyl-ACP methyl ester carboxylesterase
VPSDLISAGFSLISFDLPCHGADASDPNPLLCWRHRLEAGDFDLFTRFCAGFSATLDELGVTEFSIVGQSRGAYIATICTAHEPRVRNLLLIAPLTDLQRLWEFDGYSVDQDLFNLKRYAPYVRNRNILVRVNSVDDRVGTNAALGFGSLVGAELDVIDFIGHEVPNDGRVTTWLIENTASTGE